MKSLSLVVAVVLAPAAAQADVVSFRGEVHGGGGFGKGVSGDAKDQAFFEDAPHGVYGVLVGLEFFFIDTWIQHHQFTNGDRLATWTSSSCCRMKPTSGSRAVSETDSRSSCKR